MNICAICRLIEDVILSFHSNNWYASMYIFPYVPNCAVKWCKMTNDLSCHSWFNPDESIDNSFVYKIGYNLEALNYMQQTQ